MDRPHTVQNGLALSGAGHWMFDRGLLGIAEDHRILVSRAVNDRAEAARIVNPAGTLILPPDPRNHPHPAFLAWHREHRFKA